MAAQMQVDLTGQASRANVVETGPAGRRSPLVTVTVTAAGVALEDSPMLEFVSASRRAPSGASGVGRTATVRASSGGVTGKASITVMEGPVIALSTTELSLQGRAGDPPTDTRSVEISNGGGETLTGLRISVVHPGGEPTGWLEAGLQEIYVFQVTSSGRGTSP